MWVLKHVDAISHQRNRSKKIEKFEFSFTIFTNSMIFILQSVLGVTIVQDLILYYPSCDTDTAPRLAIAIRSLNKVSKTDIESRKFTLLQQDISFLRPQSMTQIEQTILQVSKNNKPDYQN